MIANEFIEIDKRFLDSIRGRFYLFTRKSNYHFFKCGRRSSVLKKRITGGKKIPMIEIAIFLADISEIADISTFFTMDGKIKKSYVCMSQGSRS